MFADGTKEERRQLFSAQIKAKVNSDHNAHHGLKTQAISLTRVRSFLVKPLLRCAVQWLTNVRILNNVLLLTMGEGH